jgi:hypothetical protein
MYAISVVVTLFKTDMFRSLRIHKYLSRSIGGIGIITASYAAYKLFETDDKLMIFESRNIGINWKKRYNITGLYTNTTLYCSSDISSTNAEKIIININENYDSDIIKDIVKCYTREKIPVVINVENVRTNDKIYDCLFKLITNDTDNFIKLSDTHINISRNKGITLKNKLFVLAQKENLLKVIKKYPVIRMCDITWIYELAPDLELDNLDIYINSHDHKFSQVKFDKVKKMTVHCTNIAAISIINYLNSDKKIIFSCDKVEYSDDIINCNIDSISSDSVKYLRATYPSIKLNLIIDGAISHYARNIKKYPPGTTLCVRNNNVIAKIFEYTNDNVINIYADNYPRHSIYSISWLYKSDIGDTKIQLHTLNPDAEIIELYTKLSLEFGSNIKMICPELKFFFSKSTTGRRTINHLYVAANNSPHDYQINYTSKYDLLSILSKIDIFAKKE